MKSFTIFITIEYLLRNTSLEVLGFNIGLLRLAIAFGSDYPLGVKILVFNSNEDNPGRGGIIYRPFATDSANSEIEVRFAHENSGFGLLESSEFQYSEYDIILRPTSNITDSEVWSKEIFRHINLVYYNGIWIETITKPMYI